MVDLKVGQLDLVLLLVEIYTNLHIPVRGIHGAAKREEGVC